MAGCTDEKARERCIDEARNAAEVREVAYLYDAGELGTRARWERGLGAPGRPGASFFDKHGQLRPYEQLDYDHKVVLLVWIRTGPYAEKTYEARQLAAARVRPDC